MRELLGRLQVLRGIEGAHIDPPHSPPAGTAGPPGTESLNLQMTKPQTDTSINRAALYRNCTVDRVPHSSGAGYDLVIRAKRKMQAHQWAIYLRDAHNLGKGKKTRFSITPNVSTSGQLSTLKPEARDKIHDFFISLQK